MKKENKRYWWLFIGFVLFGSGITGKAGVLTDGYGFIGSVIVNAIFLIGAAFMAWGFSRY